MKKLTTLLFALLVLLVSCNKEEQEENNQIPDWLKSEFDIVQSGLYQDSSSETRTCDMCVVEVYELEGQKYYNLYCMIWSCLYCHLYDENGTLVEWEQNDWEKFMANKELIQTISTCNLNE